MRLYALILLKLMMFSVLLSACNNDEETSAPEIDKIPPIVISISPNNGANNVDIASHIRVEFSEAMDAASFNSNSFNLKDANGTLVSGNISVNGKSATLTPDSLLLHTHEYTVTLTTAATDQAGNPLSVGRLWRFTTPDQTPPEVTSFTPGDGATNVAINSSLSVVFSEAMAQGTINSSSYILKDSNNNVVSGHLTYDEMTASVSFDPDSALLNGEVYTITITSAVTDLASNSIEGPVSSSFTTALLPVLSLDNTSLFVLEGNSGTVDISFTVTLSEMAYSPVTVNYATSDISATAGSDYVESSGILSFNTSETSKTITVQVAGDTTVETDEKFSFTLSNASSNVTLGVVAGIGVIMDDDANGQLNDTGIINCSNLNTNGLNCNDYLDGTDLYPGQDAETGRDALAIAGQLSKTGGGRAGFDFTKLDANGIPLPNQSGDYATMPWSCVKDNNTGLVWEVKTPGGQGGLRDSNYTYSWYNSDPATNGGDPGTENGGVCAGGSGCDTEKYTADVNAIRLCGYTDWRLPALSEVRSIVDYGVALPGPTIDTNYFPNTGPNPYRVPAAYWSSTPDAACTLCALDLNFDAGDDGDSGDALKSGIDPHVSTNTPPYVRLVRGGS